MGFLVGSKIRANDDFTGRDSTKEVTISHGDTFRVVQARGPNKVGLLHDGSIATKFGYVFADASKFVREEDYVPLP